jgi:WD40 repeat protein
MSPLHLRIFLSSPGDVAEERRLAMEVLAALPRQPLLGGKVTIEPVAWDDAEAPTPLAAGVTPQRSVNRHKPRPAECDLTLVILWSRLGTPLPGTERRADGRAYESGTIWEFEDALGAGKSVYVYYRTEKPRTEIDDLDLERKREQYEGVKAFLGRLRDPDGSLRGGYQEYATPEQFRGLLEKHLESYVRSRLEDSSLTPSVAFSRVLPTGINTAPRPTVAFVNRPAELEALIALLLEARGQPKDASTMALTTAFRGGGGFGKTTLAKAVCHDPRVRAAFPDAILWIDLGETPDLTRLLARQVELLTGASPSTVVDERTGMEDLRRALQDRAVLLVLDDVWQEAHARPFLQVGPAGAHLLTTRNQQLASGLHARIVSVNEMRPEEAAEMLGRWLEEWPTDRARLAALAQWLGEWPLLLALVGAHLRELVSEERLTSHEAVSQLQRLLSERGITALDPKDEGSRHKAVAGSLEASLARLSSLRDRYLDLGIFPEDIDVPFGQIERLWNKTAAMDEAAVGEALRAMRRLSLFTQYDAHRKILRLHDVVRSYLREQLGRRRAAVNAALLDAGRTACGDDHWASLPVDEVYLWRQLAYHLIEAERKDELRQLALGFRWLAAKLAATDIAALLSDFDLLDLPTDEAGRMLRDALRLCAHILRQHPEQLAGQLQGRLGMTANPVLRSLLEEAQDAAPRPRLRPLWPSLQASGGPLLRTLEGHQGMVNAVAITPDGKAAVSGSTDNTLKVWILGSGSLLRSLEGHGNWVLAVAVTPDGTTAISGSADKTLKVWDMPSGQLLRGLEGHREAVNCVAVTPDAKTAVSGSTDKTLRVWDIPSGRLLRTLEGHQHFINAVAISPDGRIAVSGSDDHTLKVWDLASGTLLSTLKGHRGSVFAVAIASEGPTVVSTSEDRTLKVWDLASGSLLRTLEGHRSWVNAVAITPDGRTAVSGSEDHTLRVWDLASGRLLGTLEGHPGRVSAIAISPRGQTVVSGSFDHTLKVWDLAAVSLLNTREGHQRSVFAVAITPDGRTAVSGARDHTLKVWHLASGSLLHTLEGHRDWVNAVAITPDGKTVVSGSRDKTLKVWDLASASLLRTIPAVLVNTLAIAPDGKTAVAGHGDNTLKVWDLASGAVLGTLEGHRNWVNAVAITPDGLTVVSGSLDKTVRVWDLASGTLLHTLEAHEGRVNSVAITREGRIAVSGSRDATLRVWDLASGVVLRTLEGHQSWVYAVAITPNGRTVVSGSEDHTLKVWDLASGRPLASFTGDAGCGAVAMANDGRHVFVGDDLGRLHYLALELD